MKYLTNLFFIVSIISSSCASSQKQIIIKEIHHAVNNDGIINKDSIIEIREYFYNRNGAFLSGKAYKDSEVIELISDSDSLSSPYLSLTQIINGKFDAVNRIIEFDELISDSVTISHVVKYDDRGNIAGHLQKMENSQYSPINSSYDYYYPSDFTYAKKRGRKFISGFKTSFDPIWLTRTIRQNGKIISYTERKIQQ